MFCFNNMSIIPINEYDKVEYAVKDGVITVNGNVRVEYLGGGVSIINHIHVNGHLILDNHPNGLIICDDVRVSKVLLVANSSDVLFNNSFKYINSLSVNNSTISGFSCNELKIDNTLNLSMVEFNDCFLPEKIDVGGSLIINKLLYDTSYNIKHLSVQENFACYNTPIILPDDLFVGKNLMLRNITLLHFGNNMIILGSLYATECLFRNDLESGCFIGGFIDIRGSENISYNEINIKCHISLFLIHSVIIEGRISTNRVRVDRKGMHIERVVNDNFKQTIIYPKYEDDDITIVHLSDGRTIKSIFNNSNRHMFDSCLTVSGFEIPDISFVEFID